MARRLLPAVALAAAAAALLTVGCSVVDGPTKKDERTYSVDGTVLVVDADTGSGNITVVPVDGGSGPVRVTEKYEYSGQKPAPEHSLKDGRFRLKRDDCGRNERKCTVSYELTVPRTTAVDLRTSGGDISVRGTSGEIAAHTSGGSVDVEDSTAKKVVIRTSGGDVKASFGAAPDQVDGQTNGGDVKITVPRETYAVDASTKGGNREVTVPTDDRAPRHITARTKGGDVKVAGA